MILFPVVNAYEEPTTVFDLRKLSSNQLQYFRPIISMDNTSLLNINSKAEIITLDNLLSSSNEELVINKLRIYFDEDMNNEFVLHFLFKILANDNITVVLTYFFVLENKLTTMLSFLFTRF